MFTVLFQIAFFNVVIYIPPDLRCNIPDGVTPEVPISTTLPAPTTSPITTTTTESAPTTTTTTSTSTTSVTDTNHDKCLLSDKYREALVDVHNTERRDVGYPPLAYDCELEEISRNSSQKISELGYSTVKVRGRYSDDLLKAIRDAFSSLKNDTKSKRYDKIVNLFATKFGCSGSFSNDTFEIFCVYNSRLAKFPEPHATTTAKPALNTTITAETESTTDTITTTIGASTTPIPVENPEKCSLQKEYREVLIEVQNTERRDVGYPPLTYDCELEVVSRNSSQKARELGYSTVKVAGPYSGNPLQAIRDAFSTLKNDTRSKRYDKMVNLFATKFGCSGLFSNGTFEIICVYNSRLAKFPEPHASTTAKPALNTTISAETTTLTEYVTSTAAATTTTPTSTTTIPVENSDKCLLPSDYRNVIIAVHNTARLFEGITPLVYDCEFEREILFGTTKFGYPTVTVARSYIGDPVEAVRIGFENLKHGNTTEYRKMINPSATTFGCWGIVDFEASDFHISCVYNSSDTKGTKTL